MDDIVVLKWTFSPTNYFEEAIRVEREGYSIIIEDGNIEARINSTLYDDQHKMRNDFHNKVNDRFLGVELLTHKPYNLSKSSKYRLDSDGQKHVTIFPESIVLKTKLGRVDIVHRDKNGNIISDSRRDRIEKKKEFAELVAKYKQHDEFIESMLGFYKEAIHDPKNELVHLYDVWEALVKRFGKEKAVKTTLAITDSQRRRLGALANYEPLRQGRHRGKKVGELRDVTESELKEARSITRNMIEAYLHYLDS